MIEISVVVVTFNRLELLKLTIESILNQTFKNVELLIVGDGHQNDVRDYISSLAFDNVKYSYVAHCGYPAKARNLGISMARGKYIAFCDDDDLWDADKLEMQHSKFKLDQRLSLCFTNRKTIDSVGNVVPIKNIKYLPTTHLNRKIFYYNFITYSSVLVKKSELDKVGGFIDDINFKAVEDYHMWLKLSFLGDFLLIEDTFTAYRVHSSNISKSLVEGTKKVIKVYDDIFKRNKVSVGTRLLVYLVTYLKLGVYKILK